MKIRQQGRALNRALESGDLDAELAKCGATRADIRYRYPAGVPSGYRREFEKDMVPAPRRSFPFVSFFAGAGGLDLGFERAGCEHVLGIDNDPLGLETQKLNRPDRELLQADISDPDFPDVLEDRIGLGFDGAFIGGPPCQSFSVASNQNGRRGGLNDPRGNLSVIYIDLIRKFQPRFFLIENVLPFLKAELEHDLLHGFRNYRVALGWINAADQGVPQRRIRAFVLGNKFEHVDFPEFMEITTCGKFLERDRGTPREHGPEVLLRWMELRPGERDHVGRVNRLNPFEPAPTVIGGGSTGGGRSNLHPFKPRTLTPEESAILQTFPEDYRFCGPPARQFTQIGNAVPPVLAARLAACFDWRASE